MSIKDTYKSLDTEEWLDIYFNRPIGYLWACFFRKLGIHPNVVTVISIFLGVAAGFMFAHQGLWWNLAGIALLMWANFYDSADGQLARMTGQKTRMGRILDGFAGDLWFISIYVGIAVRMTSQWGVAIWFVCILAGMIFHRNQCQLADYYRNAHLYFLPDGKTELETPESITAQLDSIPRKGNFWWRAFLWGYRGYVRHQQRLAPCLFLLLRLTREQMPQGIPSSLRLEFCEKSLPMMKYANFLTFNSRAIVIYISCLLNIPWIYPLIEIFLFTPICFHMQGKHEAFSFALYQKYRHE